MPGDMVNYMQSKQTFNKIEWNPNHEKHGQHTHAKIIHTIALYLHIKNEKLYAHVNSSKTIKIV